MSVSSLRHVLENSADAHQRMRAVVELREMLSSSANREAAEEILLTVMNDFAGEVVLGSAFAVTNLPGRCAASFRQWTLEKFREAGDRSTSKGAPLLRLAYIAALEKDAATLKQMASLRQGEMGVDRITQLATAVDSSNDAEIFRILAWSEVLDRQYDTAVLKLLPMKGANEFRQCVESAISRLKDPAAASTQESADSEIEAADVTVGKATVSSPLIRRDGQNDPLRTFYHRLNLNDAMLAECDQCGLLLTKDGGGMIGGIGMLSMVQNNPQAVAAFVLTMRTLLGNEHVPEPSAEGAILWGMGLLGHFQLADEAGQKLCPACRPKGHGKAASAPVSTARPPVVTPSAPPAPPVPTTPAQNWAHCLREGKTAEAFEILSHQPLTEHFSLLEKVQSWQPPESVVAKFKELLANRPSLSPAELNALVAVSQTQVSAHANKTVTSLAVSGDEKLLASGGWDGKACLWSLPDMTRLHTLECGDVVTYQAFSANGKLVTASRGGTVMIWDVNTGKRSTWFQVASKEGYSRIISLDRKWLLASDETQRETVTVWSLEDGKPVRTFQGMSAKVDWLFPVQGGPLAVVVAKGDKSARIFDIVSGKLVASTSPHATAISLIATGPSGLLATADEGGCVRVWSLPKGTLRCERAGCGTPLGLAFVSPDQLLAVGKKKTLVWSLSDDAISREGTRLAPIRKSPTHPAPGGTLAVTQLFDSAGNGAYPLVVQSTYDGKMIRQFAEDTLEPVFVGTPGELSLIAGTRFGSINRWNITPLELLAFLQKPPCAWTREDLSLVKRLCTSGSLSPHQQKSARTALGIVELCRELAPTVFQQANTGVPQE